MIEAIGCAFWLKCFRSLARSKLITQSLSAYVCTSTNGVGNASWTGGSVLSLRDKCWDVSTMLVAEMTSCPYVTSEYPSSHSGLGPGASFLHSDDMMTINKKAKDKMQRMKNSKKQNIRKPRLPGQETSL